MSLHPTAVVDALARLGRVTVGAYAVIGADVELADGVEVGPHAVLSGPMAVGVDTRIGPHAVLGGPPQSARHDGSATLLLIGARNVFREFSTAHRGSSVGSGETRIGDDNLFMVGSHVAHDAIVGSRCTFANQATVAGHVEVADEVTLGGFAAVHQHVRVGRLAMVAAGAICTEDVPPFSLVQGDRARWFGWNTVGLRRAGWTDADEAALRRISQVVFGGRSLPVALGILAEDGVRSTIINEWLAFALATRRGLCPAARGGTA